MQPPSSLHFAVPHALQPFAAIAVERLAYLNPNWRLLLEASVIVAEVPSGESEEPIARGIRYALYREKILAETMDMRRDLLRMVSRS